MTGKYEYSSTKEQQTLNFTKRFCYVFLSLFSFVFITYVLNFLRYGYSADGKMYHSHLDYPNEIASTEAIELSDFIASLQEQWKNDIRIHYPFEQQTNYLEKEINLNDPVKKQSVLTKIAGELGIISPSHIHSDDDNCQKIPSDLIAGKIRGGPPKKNIAIPNNMEYLSLQNNNQCDDQRLQFKASKIISFHPKEISQLSAQLDGVFQDSSGTVHLRKASIHELNDKVVFNLTLFGQSESVLSHVSLSETNKESSKKIIHIHNSHPSTLVSCLTYHIDIVFPATIDTFKEVDLRINHARTIQGDLRGMTFQQFTVGLGRGSLLLDHIEADHILLGNLNGIIRGTFFPLQTMGAATVKGSTNVKILPKTKSTRSTIVALHGPVKAVTTGSGKFIAHCWLCEPVVTSETREDAGLHFYASRRPEIKSGYYGKKPHYSHVHIHSIQGESKLTYI